MFDGLIVAAQFELELDGLLQALESPVPLSVHVRPAVCPAAVYTPVAFFLFESGHTKEFINSLLGVVGLHLLGIVVLVLNVDVAALVLVFVFVLKVVAARASASCFIARSDSRCRSLLLVRVLHEIVVVGHCGGV